MDYTNRTTTKYLNIDTRINNNEDCPFAEYTIRLPEKIHNVKSLSIVNIELPITFFNISACMNNNFFKVTRFNAFDNIRNRENECTIIILPDDNYTVSSLVSTLEILLRINILTKDLLVKSSPTNTIEFFSNRSQYTLDFAIDLLGNDDNRFFKSKFGWLLGFRFPCYTIKSNTGIVAETICDLTMPRYLYLSIEDCNDTKNAFFSSLFSSYHNKNIIARIALDNNTVQYGSVLPANLSNGFLVSDIRKFEYPIELRKLKIKVLNEFGCAISLNGFEISFLMNIEQEICRSVTDVLDQSSQNFYIIQ
jgi:hypothetical protein